MSAAPDAAQTKPVPLAVDLDGTLIRTDMMWESLVRLLRKNPFAAIFARYNHDFYAVDPMLFSPAEIVLQNIDTGRVHAFGSIDPEILSRSFDS